jgi:hypothetical protein
MKPQVKATTRNSSALPLGHAKNNKAAETYAKKGTGVSAEEMATQYQSDPNNMRADESTPGGMPARRVSIGNITRGPKTDGIEMRGAGAATKGRMSRGPMA